MEHLLQRSKCSIFHDIFKYIVFQMHQKALLWRKGSRQIPDLRKLAYLYKVDTKKRGKTRLHEEDNNIFDHINM